MTITIDIDQLKTLLRDSAELGVANYIKQMTPKSDNVSQREAYRLYGEARIRKWLDEKMISVMKQGKSDNCKMLYSRAELMAADKTERILYQIGR